MNTIKSWLMAAGPVGQIRRWVWIGGIALLIGLVVAGVALADRLHENTIEVAEEAGATKVRADAAETTLKRAEQANDVRSEVRREGDRMCGPRLYQQCMRYDRGAPASCQRFLCVDDADTPGD